MCHKEPFLQHSSSFSHIGWNTHLSVVGAASFSDITDFWFEEGKDFLYSSGRCKKNATCQHYTQVFTSIYKPYTCLYEVPQLHTVSVAYKNAVFCVQILSCLVVGLGYFKPGGLCQPTVLEKWRTLGDICLCILSWVTICFPKKLNIKSIIRKHNFLLHIFSCFRGNWEVNGQLVMPYKSGLYCSLCTSSMSGCLRLWDHVGGLCGKTNTHTKCIYSCIFSVTANFL